MTNVLWTLLIAALVPMVTFANGWVMKTWHQRRKYKELRRDPRFRVGAVLSRIESDGRDQPILHNVQITAARPGFYGFRTCHRPYEHISFTGQEVEKLYLIYEDDVE